MKDNIKQTHYAPEKGGIDVIAFCEMHNVPFTEGNIIKYIVRWKQKNGVEDLQKAKEYLDRLISIEANRMPF